MGLDSITTVEFSKDLSLKLGLPIPSTLLFDHPTLPSLAEFISFETIETIETIDKKYQLTSAAKKGVAVI